jgi:putative transcriptional regulator
MIPLLRFVLTIAVLGVAGTLSVTAAAEERASGFLPMAMAPGVRPPSYGLARGMFVVASRRLVDPNFSESVVLLIEYDAKGALGLIVNRPTTVQLTDLLPGIEEFKERADIVYVGGPVSKNRILVLMRSVQQPTDAGRVFADTYVSSSMETLKQAVSMSLDGGTFHTFVGYAGWGPGQLDDEVSRGDWHVTPGEEAIVFDRASEEIWPELIEKNSGQWVRDAHPRLHVASGHR